MARRRRNFDDVQANDDRDDHVKLDGVITNVFAGGQFEVKTDAGAIVRAQLGQDPRRTQTQRLQHAAPTRELERRRLGFGRIRRHEVAEERLVGEPGADERIDTDELAVDLVPRQPAAVTTSIVAATDVARRLHA